MRSLLFGLCLLVSSAQAQTDFSSWLAEFRQEALAKGISQNTLDTALGGLRPAPRVIEYDTSQPESVVTFLSYLNRHVTPQKIARGRALLIEHQALFADVEQRYGVPRQILAAFWGMETNYGSFNGETPIPAALATLAYDGRRSAFFRAELLDALRIIDAGDVTAENMKGSWAGAMGQMQFMPSTYRRYAVDGDGDGRVNLWTTADAVHSAGNYLSQAGWKSGQRAAIQVRLPVDFQWGTARLFHRRPIEDWKKAGVTQMSGEPLAGSASWAGIVLPQGWRGPAFMVFDNFDVIMQWNRSVSYALSVAMLAQRLVDDTSLMFNADPEPDALSRSQMMVLQQQLTQLGFDAGGADGLPGNKTQTAIRRYQSAHHLPIDGYASSALFEHVQQVVAATTQLNKLEMAVPAPTFSEVVP